MAKVKNSPAKCNYFLTTIVPKIKSKYEVLVYPHHIKVILGHTKSMDYYFKGERATLITDGKNSQFMNLTYEELSGRLSID
jgi:hypothetical protein